MESLPIEWYDQYMDTEVRKIYTQEEHRIPGLRMFGYNNCGRATSPLPLHYHKSCFEVHYIVKGNLNFSAEHCVYSLSGGDLFITLPDEIHNTGEKPLSPHELYWFQLEVDDLENVLYLNGDTAEFLIHQLFQVKNHVIKAGRPMEPVFKEIFRSIRSGTPIDRVNAAQNIAMVLCQIVKYSSETRFKITPDIGNAINYIMDNLTEELSLEEIAAKALLSLPRFKQKFKDQLGTSPRNFINYQKIELAKIRLSENRDVTQTAMELGFSSSNYFSVVFRRFTSITPTAYIQRAVRQGQAPSTPPTNPLL